MHLEIVVRDRVTEVVLQLEAGARARVQLGVEQLVPRLAARLRVIHRRVGVAHDVVGPLVVGRAERDPDARRCEHFAGAHRKRRAQRLLDAEGNRVRLPFRVELIQQDRELVAAKAGNRVAGPQARLEAPRHRDEQLVSDEVTEAVIDHFEPIEVEIQHGEPTERAPLLHLVEPPADALDEHRAGVQAGERIDELHAAKPLLRNGDLRRVGQRAGNADRLTAASRGEAAAQDPKVAAVRVAHPAFVMEIFGLAGEMRVDRLLERSDIFGMHPAGPFFRPRDSGGR